MTPDKEVQRVDRKRMLYLTIGLFALFSLLIAHYFKIQITDGEKWRKIARRQHYFAIKEPFLRGTFYSNTGIKKAHPETLQKLVVDVQKFHLYIDPISIPPENRNQMISKLLKIPSLTPAEKSALSAQFKKKSRSRKLAMWLDSYTKEEILEWWLPFAKKNNIVRNALFFVSDYQRSYPFGKLLGQVLHTIQNNKDEITKQALPTGGLELAFNKYLQGKQGKRRLMRSPRNALETGELILAPQNGADIYLTINHCLQAIAEEEITKGVKKSKAKAGWAAMMDPYTGEILALAQYPFFTPSDYKNFFNDPLLIEHTKVKSITDTNEPGSVMKPFTIAIGLMANDELVRRSEKPIFSPEEKMDTSNSRFSGRSKPLTDTHFHHYLNMNMAIQKSSNIYMARLVERFMPKLGKEWYRNALQETFGFGLKTGIELPAESSGVIPTPGKKHPNGTFEWSGSTQYSLAMGYNIQCTSLQLLRAYAVLANGGYLVKPTLIKKIVRNNEDGSQTIFFDRSTLCDEPKKKVLDDKIIDMVVNAMKFVTKTGGTASRANIWGFTEAGKTSTAKKIVNGSYSETQYYATFVGFAPVENPAFILLVGIDEPEYGYKAGIGKLHHGGTCSAPVFREIASRSLAYLGVTPDDPFGYPKGDPRCNSEKADWMPEIQKLKEMYESWNKSSH